MVYGYSQGMGWITETAVVLSGSTFYPHLKLDSQGNPHLSYSYLSNIWYTFRDESGWKEPKHIYNVGVGNSDNSLALDKDDHPHISFRHEVERSLKYAYWDSVEEEWVKSTFDTIGFAGWDNSLVLDKNGAPYIVYLKLNYRLLTYAYRDSSSWHTEEIDQRGENYYPSLTVDSQSRLHVSYSNFLESEEKHTIKYLY